MSVPETIGQAAPGVIEATGGRAIDETDPARVQVDVVDHRAQVIAPHDTSARAGDRILHRDRVDGLPSALRAALRAVRLARLGYNVPHKDAPRDDVLR